MTRYRWFNCVWPRSIKDVATMLMAHSFSYDTGHGFKIDKTRPDYISGKYLVRYEIEDNISDPFTGNVTTSQRIAYEVVNFNLTSSMPSIEVIDPPRSLIGFISALSDAIKSNITINNIELDLIKYMDILNNNLHKPKITMIDCSNIVIDLNTTAKLTISGSEDVRVHLKEMLEQKKHKVDKTRISYMNQAGVISYFEITSKGSVKMTDSNEELLPILKDCLQILYKTSVAPS